jgi:hypothetical protein
VLTPPFFMTAQEASGDWPQQHISGVFNRNCMITYANYRRVCGCNVLTCVGWGPSLTTLPDTEAVASSSLRGRLLT